MPAERILVALSGGVDSSVAALLLKEQGHDLVGAYMKNWINEDEVIGHCPWQQDIADARAVSEQLGIEFRVVNLMAEYRERVVAYLLDGYARGLTPNPDITQAASDSHGHGARLAVRYAPMAMPHETVSTRRMSMAAVRKPKAPPPASVVAETIGWLDAFALSAK